MKFPQQFFILFSLIILGLNQVYAAHLLGGDISYLCLGKNAQGLNQYEISVSVMKDCVGSPNWPIGNTPFDKTIRVRIFDGGTSKFVKEITLNQQDSTFLVPVTNDSCGIYMEKNCFARATYQTTVFLPDNLNGYHITWSRCCLVNNLTNISNSDGVGMTLSGFIPNTGLCNNSPQFVHDNPLHLCLEDHDGLSFDISTEDPDGDSLTYELSIPFQGGGRLDPLPVPLPPPHAEVSYLPSYNRENPIDGIIELNHETGVLTVKPEGQGNFIFSVTVKEFRNQLLISESVRNLQLSISSCSFVPQIMRPESPQIIGDTIIFIRGIKSCFSFTISNPDPDQMSEENLATSVEGEIFQTLGATFYGQGGKSPLYGVICWEPTCDQENVEDDKIILKAEDSNECPGSNITLDTLYVKLESLIPDCEEINPFNQVEIFRGFPNPFSEAITIDFVVRKAGTITIDILDLQGRKVETLEKYYSQGGLYQWEWNPNGVTSGMYICQMQMNESTAYHKIVYQHN
ncbi:MAG: T9SS type A sorting domain-containing protein [Bacteroidetes bacterium]|nr:T9SS type A sorting domain-containing protein [Bacteroidota bacterium]